MSLRDELLGTWEIFSYTLKDEQGVEYYPFGKDCKGYLMYTSDGHVSAQLMRRDRKKYTSGDLHNGTVAEMAEAAHGYMAYAGTFEIDETALTVMHHIDISMNPTWESQSQVRYVKLENGFLTITADVNTAALVWKKTSSIQS